MAITSPVSPITEGRLALINLLTEKFAEDSYPELLGGCATWDNITDAHGIGSEPLGLVDAGRAGDGNGPEFTYRTTNYEYEMAIRLIVSFADEQYLRYALESAENYIITQIMPIVSSQGIYTTITLPDPDCRKIEVRKALHKITYVSSNIYPRINQDEGGKGCVVARYRWQQDQLTIPQIPPVINL